MSPRPLTHSSTCSSGSQRPRCAAIQLYLHNNPTYLRALDLLRNAFVPIWTHTDTLIFDVSDTQITWGGHVVVNEPDKTGDALPWVLYKDGIRELTFLKGVEAQ